MIVCPRCKSRLYLQPEKYYCQFCQYQAFVKDGAVYFITDTPDQYENYDANGLEILYQMEKQHFWFKNRRQIIVNIFHKHVKKSDHIIEIGAGTGSIAKALLENGYNISVGEIHSLGLEYAKSYGIKECFQVDLFACPFQKHFDVVGMFDVLEHFEDEALALQNVHTMLTPGSKLVLTVPAHDWLWNRDDELALHKRRYTIGYLRQILEKNGFEVIEIKHFFLAILPLLYLRTFLHPAKKNYDDVNKEIQEYDMNLNKIINWILDKVTCVENIILEKTHPTIGGSIICVARKRT